MFNSPLKGNFPSVGNPCNKLSKYVSSVSDASINKLKTSQNPKATVVE